MNYNFFKKNKINPLKEKGFSLVELMVVLGILLLISAIGILGFSTSKEYSTLQSDAENLAFNIRKAQSMAMAVNSIGNNYQNGYGVYFNLFNKDNLTSPQEVDPFSYLIFTDFENAPKGKNWDLAYLENITMSNCGSPVLFTSECYQKTVMTNKDYIADIQICDPTCNTPTSQMLAITFFRPNLDAYFCVTPASSGGCTLANSTGYVKITLKTYDHGIDKSVYVWSTGQISIE
jgi:prepilin-type N-terminal cleavage/methylation domain-containing protein